MIAGCARDACWRGFRLKAALLVALLMAFCHRAPAQEATKMVRIGVLASAEEHPIQSFKERLHELGWIAPACLAHSFDDLVGLRQQDRRYGDAECLRGLQVDVAASGGE